MLTTVQTLPSSLRITVTLLGGLPVCLSLPPKYIIQIDTDENAGYGFSVYLTSAEFDNISTGICPLLEMEISKYCFLEPLSMMSGIHYVTSSSMLSSQCLVHVTK